jgi:uncharacterized protein YhaN
MALRIEQMDLSPWGCFEDQSLTFSPNLGDVDLIQGANASGKSTASRAEIGLLYGIEERTADSHTYDYTDLRIGARLRLDGTSIELSRRKRRVGSLVDPEGNSLPDDLIVLALGGLTEQVYKALFQVDHDTLVQGGAELLQGQGEIGASLFAAAAGIATLHATLAALDGEAERLFNPRRRTSVLHKALGELRDAEKRLRDATLRPARHREMTRALDKAEQACEALARQTRELELRARVIERKRAIAPLLDAHSERTAELTTLVGTPDLPESGPSRRADAQGRIHAGTAALKRTKEVASKLDSQINAIEVDGAVTARDEEIRAIKESISAIRKAVSDRRKREGELQEATSALKTAAAAVGVDPDEIESLRRPATARRALDDCLGKRGELSSRLSSADSRARDAEQARQDAEADLAAAVVVADVRELEAAITAALKVATLSEQIEQGRLDATLRRREATERMARMTPPPSSLDDLRILPSPSHEHAERAATRNASLQRAAEDLDAEASRLLASELELAAERERVDLEGKAPSAEVLANAREVRDERWTTIRGDAVSGSPLAPTDADDFEHALAEADHLADLRTDHAALIERAAAVNARETRLERERANLDARRIDLRERETTANGEWAETWSVTGLGVIAPEDAVHWLSERDAILELDRAACEAELRTDRLLALQLGHADALSAQLRELGHDVAKDVPLDGLIARSQGVIAEARELTSARVALQTGLMGAQRELTAAEREQGAATDAWSKWEKAWPQQRLHAGLPETATPDAAQEIVRAVDEGIGQLKRIADLVRRIAGIDTDEAEFEARVRSLCEDLAPELLALDPERAASALNATLAEHERRKARRDSLVEQRAGVADELATIESEIALAQSEIDVMLGAAGCVDPDELVETEIRAARARVLRSEISELERQVAEVGEGRFTELVEGADDFDRDSAALELSELRDQIEELRVGRDEIREQIGKRKRELVEVETDIAAVQAAQDVELARAAVQEAANAHAKAKIAAMVVRRAIDRYRRLHQDPLLRRANELFKRFTLGSFVELFVDVDERGEGILIGRQRDRVLKRVPQMSKGTREQLYLALRIAAIERYVATAGPVPVIFDDVFIESDAPRSERIFEALGELATKTQVIVLTHHEHLVEVGRRALKDKLIVQGLPDAAPTLREAAAA